MEVMTNPNMVLEGQPAAKRSLGRSRQRREDNNKAVLKEIGWKGVKWFNLIQARDRWWILVNTVMNLGIQQKARNSLTSYGTTSFSRTLPSGDFFVGFKCCHLCLKSEKQTEKCLVSNISELSEVGNDEYYIDDNVICIKHRHFWGSQIK
jgi:hypothetical protein